jgi:hypothetical protein
MPYQFKAKATRYKGVLYRSRLEAKWAVFFDLIGWKFDYEPYDLEKWSPDFKVTTEAGSSFLVEVKPEILIDKTLRLKLGEASNYADGILLVDESPFKFEGHPNCIGMTSVFGKTKNHKDEDDFEFCSSVVMNLYGAGNEIYNLCMANMDVHDRLETEPDFCTPLWSEAVNAVQFLKPKI